LIAVEGPERYIASPKRRANEAGLHIEFRIFGRIEQFRGRHDAQADSGGKLGRRNRTWS